MRQLLVSMYAEAAVLTDWISASAAMIAAGAAVAPLVLKKKIGPFSHRDKRTLQIAAPPHVAEAGRIAVHRVDSRLAY